MSLTRRAAYAVTRGLTRVAPVRAAPLHAAAVRRLAAALGQRGKSAAALALAESAVAEHRRRDAHAGTRGAFGELLRVLAEQRATAARLDEALAAADEAVPILERETGSTAGRVRLARAHALRSDILLGMDRPDEAAADAETAIAALPQAGRLTSTERHALVLALRRQASSQLALGRYAEAGEPAGAHQA